MKVLYDYQAFYRDKVGGVSRYFYEVIRNLPAEVKTEIKAFSSINTYIKGEIGAYEIPFVKNKVYTKLLRMCNDYVVKKALKKDDFDIFHVTNNDPYYLPYCKKPVVTTIHDMIWEKFHMNPSMEVWRKKQCETADRIITVSNWTKKDLIEIYGVNPDKVTTIYHGISPVPFIKHSTPYGRYVLFVGKRGGYKNFNNFLKAMSIIIEQDSDLNIVCTGLPFSSEEMRFINDLHLRNHIYNQFVSDEDLYNLYANAEVFVYPSKYEGFGIPILESFYCNCPVVLSDASCFPEIGQNAVEYFEVDKIDAQAEAIKNVLYNNERRDELITLGRIRLADFSWQKSGQLHYELYKSMK